MVQLQRPAALPGLTRVRVLEGSAELLLGQLRLHAKRVRALAASFRRETRRLATADADLRRIDDRLDAIAERITAALTAIDAGFTAAFDGIAALDGMGATVDLQHPEHTPAQRIAARARELSSALHGQYDEAHRALRDVADGLVAAANNLAIVVGRPGAQSLNQLRVIIRQMRALSRITAEIGARLDVFVQNTSAALLGVIPGDIADAARDARDTVLAQLGVQPVPSAPPAAALADLIGAEGAL